MKHTVEHWSLAKAISIHACRALKLLPVYISRITTSFYRPRAIQARTLPTEAFG